MATYLISLSLLIIAVIIIRAIFRRKTSQRLIYAMWLLVVVRMILPFSLFEIEIPNSLYASITPDTETILQNEIPSPETDEIISSHDSESTIETDVGINAGIDNDTIDSTEDIAPTPPAIPETAPVVNTDNKAHKIEAEKALYFIWGAGAAAMSLWFFISWLLFTFKLWNTDVFHSEFNGIKVYISDKIASPCVAGVKPIIYITPEAAESENLSYVLAHEYTHLHHGDRVWSAVRVIATCVFWWNPLVWAAAFLSKSDAELACDESVIKGFNEGDRLAYANSIVDMTPKRSNYAIGFGNGSIKERIVMLTKITPKKLIASVIAIAIAISCIGCAYIEPKQENENIETNAPSDKENNSDVIKLSGKIEMTLEEFNGYLAHWSDIETPGENYIVEITDMSTAVTAEIHNNTIVAKIQAYGNTVNINEEAHYSMLLWEFEDAVIFEKTYYGVGDTYVITEHGIDSLHKGDDFTLSLEKSENCLYYINMCNKYSTAVQEVTAGLNVATSWDDVYYEKGVAYIENGKIVISDADVNVVLAKDAFNFESVFKAEQDNAIANGTKYYKDINDLFEANKTYIVENYEDTTTEVDESETANLDIEIQKKFSGGEVSDKIKYLCEKKITINDETYYIAKYMYLQGGEWITGETNPMYLVKEDMTKMYDAGITVDGKDLRYSKKVNYFDENDTLMVYLEKEPETTVPETTAPETNPPETTPPETTPPVTTDSLQTDISEEDITKCTDFAKNYYSYIFAPFFEKGETVNPDQYIEYFIFDEFYVRENSTVNTKYAKYNIEHSNSILDNHSIPVDIVDGWLKDHFDIIPDYTLSKRFYDGNGNYNISVDGRGGHTVHISKISKVNNDTFIIDAIGNENYSNICHKYFQIAVEIKNGDFKYHYCKDSTPKTAYTSDDAVKILEDTLGYTKDKAEYAIVYDAFTIPTLGDDIYCSIIPYVTSGDPHFISENEYFRIKYSSSDNLYVSLNTGKIYKPIYTNDSGNTPEKIELYTQPTIEEIKIDAFEAIENAQNVYKKHQDTTVYDCHLKIKKYDEKYYYMIRIYNFIEYDKEKYSNGYVPTESDILYVDIIDGKVYAKI